MHLVRWSPIIVSLLASLTVAAREVPITILTTTDLHGTILPTMDYEGNKNRGGIARLSTKIAEIRKETPNALLVDCGDTFQGTAVSYLDKGQIIVKLLNHLQYDAWTLGNHEFDWGTEILADCLKTARVPILAGNLKPLSDDAKAKFAKVQPFVIKEVDGVKVAIVGLTTPGIPNWSRPRLIPGLEFEQSVVALRRIMPQVKAAGADVIVLATHQGLRESGDDHANQLYSIVYGFPEFAAIAGGHTHRHWPQFSFSRTDIVYCQPSYWGNHLGRIDLVYDTDTKRIVRRKSTTILMDESVPLDPRILALARTELAAAKEHMSREIGVATADFTPAGAPRHETPIHNVISEAIAEALRERGAKVDAVVHGLLNDRAMLRKGKLTVADAWNIVPYDNFIGVAELTPAELKEVLEENAQSRDRFRGIWGMRMVVKFSAPVGERIVSLTDRDGRPLDESKRYKVAFNSYELASGGTRFPTLREIVDRPTSKLVEYDFQTREAVVKFIEKRRKLSPKLYGWWNPSARAAAAASEGAHAKSSTRSEHAGCLVIWEVCYRPQGQRADPNGEWIVIANDCDKTISLTGYTLSDNERNGTYHFGQGVELKSGEKLVLAYDVEAFARAAYPLAPNVKVIGYGADARGLQLNNNGDDLTLRDPTGNLVDEVWYGKQFDSREIGADSASRFAPTCRKGESIKRREGKWTVNLSPSPGS